MKQKVTHR